MTQLLHRAEQFMVQSRFYHKRETMWLSRNGPLKYFSRNIVNLQKGIIIPNIKDRSGHVKNPVNNRYRGIFFMANVEDNGLPRNISPFGPCRLMIPAYELLKSCHFYFADFYCLKPKTKHYVQIIAVKINTSQETFCRRYLKKLDERNNKFLCIDRVLNKIYFNVGIWVEIMYSHDLNIANFPSSYFYQVPATGVKSKTGLPRNQQCVVCDVEGGGEWLENYWDG